MDRKAAAHRRLVRLATWRQVMPDAFRDNPDVMMSSFWNGVLGTGKKYPVATSLSLVGDIHDGDISVILDAMLATMQAPVDGLNIRQELDVVWASIVVHGLSLLLNHLEDATLAYEFACRYAQCGEDGYYGSLKHLWRLFTAVSSQHDLRGEINIPNTVHPRWHEVFIGLQANHELFLAACRKMRGESTANTLFDSRHQNWHRIEPFHNTTVTAMFNLYDRTRRTRAVAGGYFPMLAPAGELKGPMNQSNVGNSLTEFTTKIDTFEDVASNFDSAVEAIGDVDLSLQSTVSPRSEMHEVIRLASGQLYQIARLRSPLFDSAAAMNHPYTGARHNLINDFWKTLGQLRSEQYINQPVRVKTQFILKTMWRLNSVLKDVAALPDFGIGHALLFISYPNPQSRAAPCCKWPDGSARGMARPEDSAAVWNALARGDRSIPFTVTPETIYSSTGAPGALRMTDGAPSIERLVFLLLKQPTPTRSPILQPALGAWMKKLVSPWQATFPTSSGVHTFTTPLGSFPTLEWLIGSFEVDKSNLIAAMNRMAPQGYGGLVGTLRVPYGDTAAPYGQAAHPIAAEYTQASEIVLAVKVNYAKYETGMTDFRPPKLICSKSCGQQLGAHQWATRLVARGRNCAKPLQTHSYLKPRLTVIRSRCSVVMLLILAHCGGPVGTAEAIDVEIQEMQAGADPTETKGGDAGGRGNPAATLGELRFIDFDGNSGPAVRGQKIYRLRSVSAVKRLEQELETLLEEGNHEEVLKRTRARTYFDFADVPESLVREHAFLRCLSYANAVDQSKHEKLSLAEEIARREYTVSMIQNGYLTPFESPASSSADDQDKFLRQTMMLVHLALRDADDVATRSIQNLHHESISFDFELQKAAFARTITFGKKAIELAERQLDIQKKIIEHSFASEEIYSELQAETRATIDHNKLYLQKVYLKVANLLQKPLLCSLFPDIRKTLYFVKAFQNDILRRELLKKSKKIAEEFKLDKKVACYEQAVENYDVQVSHLTATLPSAKPTEKRRVGPRAAAMLQQRDQDEKNVSQKLVFEYSKVAGPRGAQLTINRKIYDRAAVIEAALLAKDYDQAFELTSELEATVMANFAASGQAAHPLGLIAQKQEVYKACVDAVGSEITFDILHANIRYLLEQAVLVDALDKVNVLKHLEIMKSGSISLNTRAISAIVNALRGDFQEWLDLKSELAANDARLIETKRKKKARQHARRIDGIRADQTEAVEAAERNRAALERQKGLQATPKATPGVLYSSNEDSLSASQPSKQEKLESHYRHEEQRAQLAATPPRTAEEPESERKESLRLEQKRAVDANIPQPEVDAFRAAFQLSGHQARRVDDEIAAGHWRFTREELLAYFEGLGCMVTDGKGSHKKIMLPDTTTVSFGDSVVAILNEMGGSLPIPKWKKTPDFVPYYLRPQILRARAQLYLFKLRAIEEEAKASPTGGGPQ